jgi:hypothetical protein
MRLRSRREGRRKGTEVKEERENGEEEEAE